MGAGTPGNRQQAGDGAAPAQRRQRGGTCTALPAARPTHARYSGPVTSAHNDKLGTVAALRSAMLRCLAAAGMLTVAQAAVAALAWPSPEQVWPGIVVLMVAQVVALAGAAACIVGIAQVGFAQASAPQAATPLAATPQAATPRAGAGREPRAILRRTARVLGLLAPTLLVLLLFTTAVWFALDRAAALGAAVFSLVGAQVWFALRAARRVLERGV